MGGLVGLLEGLEGVVGVVGVVGCAGLGGGGAGFRGFKRSGILNFIQSYSRADIRYGGFRGEFSKRRTNWARGYRQLYALVGSLAKILA